MLQPTLRRVETMETYIFFMRFDADCVEALDAFGYWQ